MLYEHNDEGSLGISFIILGKASIPALLPLLQNETLHNHYVGSEEATIGNGYQYRIKDVAAYYLGKIGNHPMQYFPDLKERDRQIEGLIKALE